MFFFTSPPHAPARPLPEVRPASRPTRATATADQAECRSRLPSPVNSFHRHEDCEPPRRGDRVWEGGAGEAVGRGRGGSLNHIPLPLSVNARDVPHQLYLNTSPFRCTKHDTSKTSFLKIYFPLTSSNVLLSGIIFFSFYFAVLYIFVRR